MWHSLNDWWNSAEDQYGPYSEKESMTEYSASSKVEAAINKQLANEEEGKMLNLWFEVICSSRHTGRDDRATTENVMDPRTRFILYQFLNRGLFTEINGCISTGKEVRICEWY